MALSEWEIIGEARLTSDRAYEGDSSLKFGTNEDPGTVLLLSSQTDTPSQAKAITQYLIDGSNTANRSGFVARWQDSDNFVFVQFDNNLGSIYLDKYVDGIRIRDEESVSGVSDNTWTKFEFIIWNDQQNIYGRVKKNGNRIGTDLSLTDDGVPADGAVGLRFKGNRDVFYDETEVYY